MPRYSGPKKPQKPAGKKKKEGKKKLRRDLALAGLTAASAPMAL